MSVQRVKHSTTKVVKSGVESSRDKLQQASLNEIIASEKMFR